MPPVTPGTPQLYVVPPGTMPFAPLTGVTLKNTPLQVVVLIGVIDDVGFTVTVKVNGAFVPHKVDAGVTVYVAVCWLFVGLFKVPVILDALVPVPPPVMPPVTLGALQLYVVPDGTIPFVPLVGVNTKPTPPQVVAVIALITADGFTFTVTENTDPVQLPDNGVIVYVAVC